MRAGGIGMYLCVRLVLVAYAQTFDLAVMILALLVHTILCSCLFLNLVKSFGVVNTSICLARNILATFFCTR